MIGRLRRCLLIPAVGLVLVGAPALAVDRPDLPRPTSTSVPLVTPLAGNAEPGWTGEADVSANLVGVKWAGDPNTEFRVEIQQSGSDWKAVGDVGPIDVAPDEGTPDAKASVHSLDAGATNATEPVWVGRDVTAVRVTIVSGSAYDVSVEAVTSQDQSAPSGSVGALGMSLPDSPDRFGFAIALMFAGLMLGAIAVGWSPWRSRRSAAVALALTMLLVLVGCGEPEPPPPPPPAPASPNPTYPAQPAMTMHSDWGPDLGWNPDPDCAPGPTIAGQLKFAVVHHTVNSNTYGPGDSRAMVRAIWQYHVGSLGYCDIAYNFLIDRYGQIFEGRIGGIDKAVVAAHSGGFNTSSTGAAWIGDWTAEQPPQAAWDAMLNLLAWKLSVHKVDPNLGFTTTSNGGGSRWPEGTVVSFPSAIIGHRDVWATACPGNAFYPRMAELRAAVQPKIGWDTTAPTTTTTTTTIAP